MCNDAAVMMDAKTEDKDVEVVRIRCKRKK